MYLTRDRSLGAPATTAPPQKLTKNFDLDEFASRGEPVPFWLMPNLITLAVNLQLLRDALGKPIRIISGYRSTEHNSSVGGAKSSQHLKAAGADITVKGMTPAQLYCTIEGLIASRRMFEGGLGLYRGHVHYDVRGKRARWLGAGVTLPACAQTPAPAAPKSTPATPKPVAPPKPSTSRPAGKPAAPPPIPGLINRAGSEYRSWVQAALNKVMNAGLSVNGKSDDANTKLAVCAFQHSRGLLIEKAGTVTPATESALALASGTLPPGAFPGVHVTAPAAIMTVTNVSSRFVNAVAGVAFHNSADIHQWFRATTGLDFIDWFNQRIAGRGYWWESSRMRIGTAKTDEPARSNFNKVWNAIPQLYGRPKINLFEFLALLSIIINETGGTFAPITEKGSLKYTFDQKGSKASYNNSGSKYPGNRTAFDLFNDPEFLAAHGHLPLAGSVRNTTDRRWAGRLYPADFPTDPKAGGIVAEADFYKYRGRGWIQTTFRVSYKHIIEYIQKNAIAHPVIEEYRRRWQGLSSDIVATTTSNADWDRLFQQTNLIVPAIGVRIHSTRRKTNYLEIPLDAAVLNGIGAHSLWMVGQNISGSKCYGYMLKARVVQMVNELGN